MDITAILTQFSGLPVILLPLLLVAGGSIVWLMIVDRFFGSPSVTTPELEEPAEIEEPMVLIATPVKDVDEALPEIEVVSETVPPRGYNRFGASAKI